MGAPGADYTILMTTNLALPLTNWTVLRNMFESPAGQYWTYDDGVSNNPAQFYQVVSP